MTYEDMIRKFSNDNNNCHPSSFSLIHHTSYIIPHTSYFNFLLLDSYRNGCKYKI